MMYLSKSVKQELFRRGIIAPWFLLPHQHSLYDLISKTEREIIVPNISRRFGKSSVCVAYIIEEAVKKKQNIRYATAFLTDLENFIKPIFDMVLEYCPDEIRPEYLESKKVYNFPNGSTIKLIGLDRNPDGIRGNNVDILIIDEAAFVSNLEYLYKSIIVPATANRQFKIIFPSTPPINPDHFWSKELVPKSISRGTYLELTIDDNTSISPEEKQRLIYEVGGIDSTTVQREFYCKIIRDSETLVIPEFDLARHVTKLTLPTHYYALTTLDLGGSMDKSGILLCYYDFQKAKFCVYREELLDKNTSTSEITEATLELEKNIRWMQSYPYRLCDAPGLVRIDLSTQGFVCIQPAKEPGSVEANINALRLAFHHDLIEIDESCVKTIATLQFGSWTTNKKDWQRTPELGHLDLLAALLYGYRYANKNNPFPLHSLGISQATHAIPPELQQSNLERKLKEAFTRRY